MSKMERKNMDGRQIGTDEIGDEFLRSLEAELAENDDGFHGCDPLCEVIEDIDSLYEIADETYDTISNTMKVTKENSRAIGKLAEEEIKIILEQRRMKKDIAGIFGLQIILSVVFFCVHHKLVPIGGKMRDR
ncbi:MAG: hypothetical protein J6N70_07665 [Oribacterium sp.]|nr:hypothetical protein [Oribacterium sp.]